MAYNVGQVPTLRSYFAIYTDGGAPRGALEAPAGCEVFLRELPELVVPGPQDELYGPGVLGFRRFQPTRVFLLGLSRGVKGRAGTFFDDAKRVMREATRGLCGFGLDVLRLWPFSLDAEVSELSDETLAEDIFSLALRERGEHGFRAETLGLSKLDQREITFEFSGRELSEEAFLLCTHLVDWLMEHGRRVEPDQAMSFGFDRLTFLAPECSGEAFRGWHPPLVQRLLRGHEFPGAGVLEVRAQASESSAPPTSDLSACLFRSMDQRLLLEELDLTGDSPHATATAMVEGDVRGLKDLIATRDPQLDRGDSGWRFESSAKNGASAAQVSLSELARKVPEVVRYLVLPWGVRLVWDSAGVMRLDTSRVHPLDASGTE